jgi:hypothetical protein
MREGEVVMCRERQERVTISARKIMKHGLTDTSRMWSTIIRSCHWPLKGMGETTMRQIIRSSASFLFYFSLINWILRASLIRVVARWRNHIFSHFYCPIFAEQYSNKNLIQEEIKRKLNSGNACYPSVQNLLSSRLLSKNIKIRIYKI